MCTRGPTTTTTAAAAVSRPFSLSLRRVSESVANRIGRSIRKRLYLLSFFLSFFSSSSSSCFSFYFFLNLSTFVCWFQFNSNSSWLDNNPIFDAPCPATLVQAAQLAWRTAEERRAAGQVEIVNKKRCNPCPSFSTKFLGSFRFLKYIYPGGSQLKNWNSSYTLKNVRKIPGKKSVDFRKIPN